MSQPKVMVYVPFHNYKEYIRECLDSVVSQTYPNQEIIASDNGSDDGVADIIKNEYPMVKLIQFPEYTSINNLGIPLAIEQSDCEFFTHLAADDKLCPNYWEQLLPLFSSDDIGFVRVGCYQFSDKNPEGSEWRPPPFKNPLEILESNKVFLTSPIRREAFDSVGGEDLKCFFVDWDLWIRLILKGWKWATYPKPIYYFRRHPKAWSYNYSYSLMGSELTYMREKWMETLRKFNIQESMMATHRMIWG